MPGGFFVAMRVLGLMSGTSADGVDVATGEGVLRLLSLQKPGGKRLTAGAFLQSFPILAGQRFQIIA